MYILALETSCDDTSVAIVDSEYRVLANITTAQSEHNEYGGIVPEIASRLHIKHVMKLTIKALEQARIRLDDIDAVAVSVNPGLIGSLLVGVSFAKALSYSINKPLIAVNHLLGHIYANRLTHSDSDSPEPLTAPFLALVVSGGHTELVHFKTELSFSIVGQTTDDAAGEAFDKTAKLMGLGYPGGPVIDSLSKTGNKDFVNFPRAFKQKNNYNFSYSGLKTSVLYYLKDKDQRFIQENLHHIAASVQAAIVQPLVDKTINYALKKNIATIVLAGGVSANSMLRYKIQEKAILYNLKVAMPPVIYCLDNASMIGAAAIVKFKNRQFSSLDLNPFSTKGIREV